MQLFVMGSLIIVLLAGNSRFTWKVCAALITLCMGHLAYKVVKYQIPGCIFCSWSPLKITHYLDYVHMATTSYVPAYIVGIVIGYLIVEKKAVIELITLKDHIVWLATTGCSFFILYISLLIFNYCIMPQSMASFIVVFHRTFTAIAWAYMYLYFYSLERFNIFVKKQQTNDSTLKTPVSRGGDVNHRYNVNGNHHDGNSNNNNGRLSGINSHCKLEERVEEEKQSTNYIKGFSRLLLPLYFIHYLVIRTIWFSERTPYSTNYLSTVSCLSAVYGVLEGHSFLSLPLTFSNRESSCPPSTATWLRIYFKWSSYPRWS